ncbi:MAG: alkaline phosphatase family protein [Gemmatimonadota bacterium]|nr:alkaline phosphatase family protein [Gemmatimonadota bacterium]
MSSREKDNSEQPFLDIEEIRGRLRELGYLQSPVERYLSRPAGGPVGTVLAVCGKVSVLAGLLLAGLTASAALLADPGFIENPQDVLLFTGYLWLIYALVCFLVLILPSWFWMRRGALTRGRMSSQGTIRSTVLSGIAAAAFCAYLLGWWHIIGIDSGVVRPLGLISLIVLVSIFLLCLLAGRMIAFVYFFLGGVPRASRSSKGPIIRSYIVSALVVLALEGAWVAGVFLRHTAGSSHEALLALRPERTIPILLVGLDGLDSETLFRMAGSDSLPNLASLIKSGFTARLNAKEDYLAPQVWNTVATGMAPEKHGINTFTIQTLRGLSRQPYLGPVRPGLEMVIEYVFPVFKLVRASPIAASARRSRTLWEILEIFGVPAGVVNWWASWPARDTGGFILSERTFAKLAMVRQDRQVSPSAYYEHEVEPRSEFDSLVMLNETLDGEFSRFLGFLPGVKSLIEGPVTARAAELIRSVYLADLFYTRSAVYLAGKYPVGMLAVYLQGADIMSRIDERTEMVSPEQVRNIIGEYHCFLDRLLGEIISGYKPGGMVVVVCDPGKNGRQQGRTGAVIFHGIDLNSGQRSVERYSIEDIAPTMLYLAGLPVARSMHGRPRLETGQTGPGGTPKLRYVASYGPPPMDQASTPAYRYDREVIERLRSLGYIK